MACEDCDFVVEVEEAETLFWLDKAMDLEKKLSKLESELKYIYITSHRLDDREQLAEYRKLVRRVCRIK